jgi:hypothetical protein
MGREIIGRNMRERQPVDTSTSEGRGRENNLGGRILNFFIHRKKK